MAARARNFRGFSHIRWDFRLGPAAIAGWLTTVCALSWSSRISLILGGVALTIALLLAVLGRCQQWPLAITCIGIGLAALSTGMQVAARDASPLVFLAKQRASVVADGVVLDDPRRVLTGKTNHVWVSIRITAVTSHGRTWQLSSKAMVSAYFDNRWLTVAPSQRIHLSGHLVPSQRAGLTSALIVARGPPEIRAAPSVVQQVALRIRTGLRQAVDIVPPKAQGVLTGLALGDTTLLSSTVDKDFRAAGLTHLLAVSGANCTLVTGAVLLLFRRLRMQPRLAAILAGVTLVGYVIVVRPSPSVLRAAVMGGIGLFAFAIGRTRAGLSALFAGMLGLLVISPELARNPGFALSVVATGAILVAARPCTQWLKNHRIPLVVAAPLAVTTMACLATAPFIAAIGGGVSVAAIPANLAAEPAVPLATIFGLLAALISPLWTTGGIALAWVAGFPVRWLVAVAEYCAALPTSVLQWPTGLVGGCLLAIALISAIVLCRVRAARFVVLSVVLAASLIWLPSRWLTNDWPPKQWILLVCDVGQGDALVIRAGPQRAIVIDAGPDPDAVDNCLTRINITHIALFVATHLHSDHIGGLAGVFRKRTVDALEVGPLQEPAAAFRYLHYLAATKHIPIIRSHVGDTYSATGVQLEVLAPRIAFHGTHSDPNNSSIVFRLQSLGHTFLLTGDSEIEAQQALLRSGIDLRAEVLKIPHHGSSFSDPRFLAATQAKLALISVGEDNDYGHPSPQLLAQLRRLGMRSFRTDGDGDVAVGDRDGHLVVVTQR